MRERKPTGQRDASVSSIRSSRLARAHALDRAGKGPEALAAYREYLTLEPQHANAWSDFAGQLLVLNHLEEARKACETALRLDPQNLPARTNLGCIRMQEGAWEAALVEFRAALTADPQRLDTRMALAECLLKSGDLFQAEKELANILRQDPQSLPAHQLLGQLYYALGRWDDFQAELDRFRRIQPASAYLAFEQGFLDLLFGRMPGGWDGHEARWRVPGLVGPARNFPQPRWDGSPFPGKTLLLCYEQGLGDTLMFLRYAPMVKSLGGRVILEAQPALAGVAATCRGVDAVIPQGQCLPPFDVYLPLLSLPWVFRTELSTLPAEIPYLDVPDQVTNRHVLAEVLALTRGKTRIGVVWAGNPGHKRDGERSLTASTLAPLAALPGVAWFSFQLGTRDLPPLPNLISLAPLLSDFSDTAYALSGMDLVITVDTALAHLAGALGIPTLLLLAFQPDWRWMLDREDSPWYPSLRLYRQTTRGDWDTVLARLVDDLHPGSPDSQSTPT